ncbi:MAG: Na+/H+ antiporter NhaC family protein, partial [Gemmatimonadota bacterium]
MTRPPPTPRGRSQTPWALWARLLVFALGPCFGLAGAPELSAQVDGGTILESGPPAEPAAVVETPPVILGGIPFSLTLRGGSRDATFFEVRTAGGDLVRSGSVPPGQDLEVDDLLVESAGAIPLAVHLATRTESVDATYAPGWYSLLPPVIAILLALIFREVVSALFAGVWLGGLAVAGWNPLAGTWRVIDTYAVPALADQGGHTQIVVFSLLLGGMVGVISRSGGTLGIVEAVAPYASDRRRGQIATWLAGLAIFFDDYANTLIVGNTMRPITDRLKISREKLAYLVDSTAAPIAAIVPISTWVGYEISLIGDGFRIAAEQPGTDPATAEALLSASPFAVFVQTIPYRFYPLLALALAFFIAWTRRDFGSMARAEARAAGGGGLHRPGAMPATDTSVDTLEAKEGAPA